MTKKRHKLRLRKQVVMSIPIIIFIITVAIFVAIDRENIFAVHSSGIAKIVSIKTSAPNTVDDVVKLSERPFFTNLSDMTESRQKDNTVIYYAQKFKLNASKTLEIAHKLTNNFNDLEFNKNFIIAPKEEKSNSQSFTNFEAGVIYYVRDIYRNPEKYGTTMGEIRASDEIDTKRNMVDNTINLDGLTIYQYLGKICDMFGVDKSLALAISFHETGVHTSSLFVNSNNLGGQKGYGGWMKFPTLEAGIIAYVISLKNIIETYKVDMTADNAILVLSGPYVHGTRTKVNQHWTEKVTYFKNKIDEQDLFTIKK